MSAPFKRGTAQQSELVVQLLGEMADRLEVKRPDETITAVGRIALIQATTMDPALAPALRARCPEITGSLSRRDYAAQLRKIAGGGRAAQPCGSCRGEGGTVIDNSSNGVTRQSWENCAPCRGTGVQGGGN